MKYTDYCECYATFSDDRTKRFVLFRQWDKSKPLATVIGLNPSTADGEEDDPTIGFVYRVLNNNGYGGFFMTNLFTMITPYPKDLITDDNFEHAIEVWKSCAGFSKDVIFAWGRFNTLGRELTAERLFKSALCFDHLKNGSPRHPMYLKSDTKLKSFK